VAPGRLGNSRDVFSLVSRLELLMGAAPYAVRTLIGRTAPACLPIAAEKAPQEKILEEIDASSAWTLQKPPATTTASTTSGAILLEGNTVRAVRLSGIRARTRG